MLEADQFCTDFATEWRPLSRAFDPRRDLIWSLVERLSERQLLDAPPRTLASKILTHRAGDEDEVGEPSPFEITSVVATQRVGRRARLRGQDFSGSFNCWLWSIDFGWAGPTDLFGYWPDQTSHALATFDNHPNLGEPPTVKWTLSEHKLRAHCFQASTGRAEEEYTPPENLYELAADHASAYVEAANRQVSAWQSEITSAVLEVIQERAYLLAKGEAAREGVDRLLERFRPARTENPLSAAPPLVEPLPTDEQMASSLPADVEPQLSTEADQLDRGDESEVSTAQVVIITVLEEETAAFSSLLENWVEVTQPRRHFIGTTAGRSVVIFPATEKGSIRSAIATLLAIGAWTPRCVILSGITGALDRSKVHLGDVLIADQVIGYEPGKIEAGVTTPRWDPFRASAGFLNAARSVAGSASWSTSPAGEQIDGSETPPEAHFGPILSGEKVIASAEWTGKHLGSWTQAIGVEMEGAGVLLAAHEAESSPIVGLVKGVSDFADEEKSDDWQQRAAANAARFVVHVIAKLPLTD